MKSLRNLGGAMVRVFGYGVACLSGGLVSAQDYLTNDTMTEGYRKYWVNDLWGAWQVPYKTALGDWFSFGLVFSAVVSWWLYQGSMSIPAMWLIIVLVAYNQNFASIPSWAFYLFVVAWVATGLIKLLWIKWHK